MINKKIKDLKESLRFEIDDSYKKIYEYEKAMQHQIKRKKEAVELLDIIEYGEINKND